MTDMTDMTIEESENLAIKLAQLLEDKKALNVVVLNVSNQSPLFDCFVIATVESFVQIRAISGYVDEFMHENNKSLINNRPGPEDNPWILLDYGNIIVHLFLQDTREHYELEKLWHDAKIIHHSI